MNTLKNIGMCCVLIGICASSLVPAAAPAYNSVSGTITCIWTDPATGNWAVTLATNGIATGYNGQANVSITQNFCVTIPNWNGATKNTLAVALTAYTLGKTVTINIYPLLATWNGSSPYSSASYITQSGWDFQMQN
jgi:hypothetical protein